MDDLISRKAFAYSMRERVKGKELPEIEGSDGDVLSVTYALWLQLADMIESGVEVVRCKNCAWYRDEERICTNSHCTKSYHGCRVREEHYCSYGERKEQEDGRD